MKLRPHRDKILCEFVRVHETDQLHPSRHYNQKTRSWEEERNLGKIKGLVLRVVELGEGRILCCGRGGEQLIPHTVKVGDLVMTDEYTDITHHVQIDGKHFFLVEDNEIFAVIEEHPEGDL